MPLPLATEQTAVSENDRSIFKGIRMVSGVATAYLISRPIRGADGIYRGQCQSGTEGEKCKASAAMADSGGSGPFQLPCRCGLTNKFLK